jgi:hypothetical protein
MSLLGSVGSFVGDAVKTCGRAAKSGVKAVSRATGEIRKEIEKVPVIGKPLGAAYGLTVSDQWKFAGDMASGLRADKAFGRLVKHTTGDVRAVGPYAQAVVSFVPGIGQGLSGAMGAGLALANGQPIDVIILAGVKSAVPGGPLAAAAFEVGASVARGESLDVNLSKAVPGLLPEQQKILQAGLKAAATIAAGKPVDDAAFAMAEKVLPSEVVGGLKIGIAVGKGQSLQRAVVQGVTPAVIKTVGDEGMKYLSSNPMLAQAKAGLSVEARKGLTVGAGLSQRKVKAIDIAAFRGKLSANQKLGFDLALAAQIGTVTTSLPKSVQSLPSQFAFYATHGMRRATSVKKGKLMENIIKIPDARAGAEKAVKQIREDKSSWWLRFVDVIQDVIS